MRPHAAILPGKALFLAGLCLVLGAGAAPAFAQSSMPLNTPARPILTPPAAVSPSMPNGMGNTLAGTSASGASTGASAASTSQTASGQAAAGASPGSTDAAAADPFVQKNILAEATADNGVLAREKALAAGRRAAWEKLVSETGASGRGSLSDAQIEQMVQSIVIERERINLTRYTGRITVRFNRAQAAAQLGVSSGGAVASAGGGDAGLAAAAPKAPAAAYVDAGASFTSMGQWLELRHRLSAAPSVSSVQIRAISTTGALLRLGLTGPANSVSGTFPSSGLVLNGPAPGAPPMPADAAPAWQVGLASP